MSDLIWPHPIAALLTEPTIDAIPFWDGCDRGELRLPHCGKCGQFHYPPRLLCPHCGEQEIEYQTADGSGHIHSFVHVAFSPFGDFWKQELPYTPVRVQLANGVRMIARLVGDDRDRAKIGEPVTMRFASVKNSARKVPVFVRCPPAPIASIGE